MSGPAGLTALTALLCSCAAGSGTAPLGEDRRSGPAGSPSAGLLLVALGDSDTSGEGDPTGKGWVGGYGGCRPQECYDTAVRGFGRTLDSVVARITELRAGSPVVLRAITLANVVPGAEDVIPPYLVRIQTRIGAAVTAELRDVTCTATADAAGGSTWRC